MKYYIVPGSLHADKAGMQADKRWVATDSVRWGGWSVQPKEESIIGLGCRIQDSNFDIWEYLRKDLLAGDLERYLVSEDKFYNRPEKALSMSKTPIKCHRCGDKVDQQFHVCMSCATPQKGYRWS